MGLFSRLKKEAEQSTEKAREEKFYRKRSARALRSYESKEKNRIPSQTYGQYEKEQRRKAAMQTYGGYGGSVSKAARGLDIGLSSAFGQAVKQRKRMLTYSKDVRASPIRTGIAGVKGARGRPKGSFDPRYAAYGGVYEYRKRLNQQLRMERLEFLKRQQMTPQQQALLRREEARQQAMRMSPENRIIPDTDGSVRTRNIHDEINDAANIIP